MPVRTNAIANAACKVSVVSCFYDLREVRSDQATDERRLHEDLPRQVRLVASTASRGAGQVATMGDRGRIDIGDDLGQEHLIRATKLNAAADVDTRDDQNEQPSDNGADSCYDFHATRPVSVESRHMRGMSRRSATPATTKITSHITPCVLRPYRKLPVPKSAE